MKIEFGGFGVLLIIVLLYLMFTNIITPFDALFWGAMFFIILPLAIVILVFGFIIIVMVFAVIVEVFK